MPLEALASRGEKFSLHVNLYATELAVIDQLAAHYQCSRAAVVGQMALDYKERLDDLLKAHEPDAAPAVAAEPKRKVRRRFSGDGRFKATKGRK